MRSKLFVPGSRPELFEKALKSAADAISFDLEDAVAPEFKQSAREQLAVFLAAPGFDSKEKKIIVRVNAPDSPHFLPDLRALAASRVDILNIPKLESADAVRQAVAAVESAGFARQDVQLLANIETPKGLRLAAEIAAAHPMVAGLQLGLADLFEPLGIARYDSGTLRQVMMALRLAAGESGKYALDGAYARVSDPEGFRQEALLARSLGLAGKSCIHPSQIAIANDVFGPSADDIEQARRIVQASRQHAGVGAFLLDGKMIDAPFVKRAQAVLRTAGIDPDIDQ